jgi:GNAT superfamily N-acetyltransferase
VGRVSVLVVDESLTGRGIGAALLRHAESFLASHGCARVEVTSAAHREAAHRFYERQGYARQGVRFSRDLAADPDAAAGQKR